MYESEYTKFMKQYLQDHPEVADLQKDGRAESWERDPREVVERRAKRPVHKSGGAEHTFKT